MKDKSVDGLRGIAALNVVICHFLGAFAPTLLHSSYPTAFPKNEIPSPLFQFVTAPIFTVFYNGHFAVLLFLVLSGYVLALPYFRRDGQSQILERRLWGRYFRLNLPIVAAVLFSYGLYAGGLYSNAQAATVPGPLNSWLHAFFPPGITYKDAIKEAVYQSILLGNRSLVPPLWTVRAEFIGSVYLLLFYIVKPQGRTSLPLLMAMTLIYALHGAESAFFYAIFLGSLLCRFHEPRAWRVPLLLVGLYFGGFQSENSFYDFLPNAAIANRELWDQKTFYNLLGALCVAASVVQGVGSAILQGRFAQFLGKISYAIYLVHFPLVCSLGCWIHRHLPYGKISLAVNFACYLLTAFAISSVFEKFVDRKSIEISRWISSRIFALEAGGRPKPATYQGVSSLSKPAEA